MKFADQVFTWKVEISLKKNNVSPSAVLQGAIILITKIFEPIQSPDEQVTTEYINWWNV